MKNIVKKIVIYSMIGILNIGLGTSAIEASPRHDNHDNQQQEQHDDRDHRMQEENDRHEREMQRHPHESEQDWHDRQERENERHDNEIKEIETALLGVIVGLAIDND